MSNREIIESALKRVNALAGTNGKLYKDNTGWFIINQNKSGDVMRLDESSRGVEAIYLSKKIFRILKVLPSLYCEFFLITIFLIFL